MASQGAGSIDAFTSGISASTCQVTISDPYLTGAAWPALFDAASQWSVSNLAQTNNIILPPCGEKQDPVVDKCFRYGSIDDSGLASATSTSRETTSTFAHLLIGLWYDINGTVFGTDYYFRVNRIAISHGSNYPTVTIGGIEPKAVVFNQNLVNVKFDEGITVEDALKQIAEQSGFKTSFCAPQDAESKERYVLPRSLIYKGVTPDEAMKKILAATGGSMLSLPLKEYANKVSVCSRGEVSNACTVFYLGKGLYEGYEINGEPPKFPFGLINSQEGVSLNNGDAYVSASFSADKYSIKEVDKTKRTKALQTVKRVQFQGLFEPCDKRCQGNLASAGYGWKGAGPVVENKKYTQTNLYGLQPNGKTAISFLPGKVESVNKDEGKVVIKTEFWFQICKDDKSEKCFGKYIFQETTNLTEVKVKNGDEVKISQEIGSSTDDKKELTRFYILGHTNEITTIDPQLVWNLAAPTEAIPVTTPATTATGPASSVVPAAPKQSLKDWNATTTAKPTGVLMMAGHADFLSTGAPNEPQLNIELVKWAQRNAGAYGISDYVEFYLPSSGNLAASDPRSQFSKTTQAIAAGKQVIEIHNDSASGHSGVIPPTGGKRIWPLDDALASAYGSFSVNHRDGLGLPVRGGTILEVGRMDGATSRVFTSGTPAQKEALYKQLMDPLMRAIAVEKSRTGATAAPSSPQPSTSQGGKVFVGRVGSTGSSSGPHLHAQWSDGRPITVDQVREYVEVTGTVTSPYGDPNRTRHLGVDIAGNDRAEINIINGASVVSIGESKCTVENVRTDPCGGGFGNFITISTPKGNMILAHLAPETIPPNLPGMQSSGTGSNVSPTLSSAPTYSALAIETSFKGVPRALRITPGRTILSFITDYDRWIDNSGFRGEDNATDPGVWIPDRFRNWFVGEVEYVWRQGDLRVNIEANNAWGNAVISAPKFVEYLEAQRGTGEFSVTQDYYGYIRSVGDLCFPVKQSDSGEYKSSCDILCKEAQQFYRKFADPNAADTTTPGTSTSFPAANCKTGDPVKDEIIKALYSAGLKTPNAFAGALGNIQEESGFDPNVHNTSIQGFTCKTDSGVREKCYGLVQWGGSRKIEASRKCGQVSTLQCQLEFMVQEIKSRGGGLVESMNAASTPSVAAEIWRRKYEVASGGIAKRQQFAEQIVKTIKCDK